MEVGSLSSSAASALLSKALPQGAAPADRDGDNDHGAKEVKSDTAHGVGTVVDKDA